MYFIRAFKEGDELEIYQLFYDTVHHVNSKDYSQKQVEVWAPQTPDIEKWRKSLQENYTFVAIDQESNKIIGFSDLEKNGYLNRGYVHRYYQGQGIGTALLLAREDKARELGIKSLFADVSITAKAFFAKQGYVTEAEQTRILGSLPFINYRMTKKL